MLFDARHRADPAGPSADWEEMAGSTSIFTISCPPDITTCSTLSLRIALQCLPYVCIALFTTGNTLPDTVKKLSGSLSVTFRSSLS